LEDERKEGCVEDCEGDEAGAGDVSNDIETEGIKQNDMDV
jgi:hypothetical protein